MKKKAIKVTCVKRRRPGLEWGTNTQLVSTVYSTERWLGMVVQPNGYRWSVLAIEMPAGADSKAALADHGHELLGIYSSVAKAFSSAEKFARAWLKKRRRIERCSCEEIRKR